jgi:hypothetical protein
VAEQCRTRKRTASAPDMYKPLSSRFSSVISLGISSSAEPIIGNLSFTIILFKIKKFVFFCCCTFLFSCGVGECWGEALRGVGFVVVVRAYSEVELSWRG